MELISFGLSVVGGISALWFFYNKFAEWREHRIDTFGSIEKNAIKLLDQIEADKFNPSVVVGIGRSGAFLGGWLAGNLGSVPIMVFDRQFQINRSGPPNFSDFERNVRSLEAMFTENKRALVVQGASTAGSTLQAFEQMKKEHMPDWEIRYGVLYNLETAAFPVNYVAKTLKTAPKKFPWHKKAAYKKYMRIKQNS